jgi:hypothetical protein
MVVFASYFGGRFVVTWWTMRGCAQVPALLPLKRKLKRDLQSGMSIGEFDLPGMISVTVALSEPRLASRSKSGPGLLLEA